MRAAVALNVSGAKVEEGNETQVIASAATAARLTPRTRAAMLQ
jgi:hypothetical protein